MFTFLLSIKFSTNYNWFGAFDLYEMFVKKKTKDLDRNAVIKLFDSI